MKCFAENLEDYEARLDARELAWDHSKGNLVQLDAALRRRLKDEVVQSMEAGLIAALQSAARGDQHGESSLQRRRSLLRADCSALLDQKTEATQAHHERMAELRREVMLFEAVEYLELHGAAVNSTQVRTAYYMLQEAEPCAPLDAIERLRERLSRLGAQEGPRPAG